MDARSYPVSTRDLLNAPWGVAQAPEVSLTILTIAAWMINAIGKFDHHFVDQQQF